MKLTFEILGILIPILGGAPVLAASIRTPSALNPGLQGRVGRKFAGFAGVAMIAQGIYNVYETLQKS